MRQFYTQVPAPINVDIVDHMFPGKEMVRNHEEGTIWFNGLLFKEVTGTDKSGIEVCACLRYNECSPPWLTCLHPYVSLSLISLTL